MTLLNKKIFGNLIFDIIFFTWIYIALGILFLVATQDHPYEFYKSMRFIVCCALEWCLWFSFFLVGTKVDIALILAKVVIIILFNTILPIYLPKSHWVVIDIVCAAIMFFEAAYRGVCAYKRNKCQE